MICQTQPWYSYAATFFTSTRLDSITCQAGLFSAVTTVFIVQVHLNSSKTKRKSPPFSFVSSSTTSATPLSVTIPLRSHNCRPSTHEVIEVQTNLCVGLAVSPLSPFLGDGQTVAEPSTDAQGATLSAARTVSGSSTGSSPDISTTSRSRHLR